MYDVASGIDVAAGSTSAARWPLCGFPGAWRMASSYALDAPWQAYVLGPATTSENRASRQRRGFACGT
jgi:hypothetical protein